MRLRRAADRLIIRFGGPGELRRSSEPNDGDMTDGLTPESGDVSDEKHSCTRLVVDDTGLVQLEPGSIATPFE